MSSPYRAARIQSPRQGMAVSSLVLGILSFVTCGGLLIGPIAGLVLGIVAAVRAGRQPAEYGGKGLAIGGIVTNGICLVLAPVFVGMIAAIAIPSLLRARVSANEAATIGDVRTVISAEAAYQSANGGLYEGRLECLGEPSSCLPGYTGPSFLDQTLASLQVKNGYRRHLEVAERREVRAAAQKVSPTSVGGYAYVAVPVNRGQTGVRAFCGDATGIVCYTPDGGEPRVTDGSCDVSSCTLIH